MSTVDPAWVKDIVLEWIKAVDHADTLRDWAIAVLARLEELDITTLHIMSIESSARTTLTIKRQGYVEQHTVTSGAVLDISVNGVRVS